MKINKTHKKSEKKSWKNRDYTYKITCTRVVNNPRMLKEVSSELYDNVLINTHIHTTEIADDLCIRLICL